MAKTKTLPARSQVKAADTWNLSSLFSSDKAWERAFASWEKKIAGYKKFRGTLGESAEQLAACLKFDSKLDRESERLAYYASLKTSEDTADSRYQAMMARFQNVASRAGQEASYIRPEIMAIPVAKFREFLDDRALKRFRLMLKRMRRYKRYTLGRREEKLLAMQSEMSGATNRIFSQLNDADLKFGTLKNEKGETVELSSATLSVFLQSPKRTVRKAAFHQYYEQYQGHENTLAATLAGSIHRDVYYARARGYDSALSAALFPDNVPATVYDNLISAVRANLPAVHRYYDLRRRKMKLKDIHHYDTYVPILSKLEKKHTWQQAVDVILDSLAPLGSEYTAVLKKGLEGRWCDRYPNRGKRSGAFSAGSYDGDPYILMNYQPTVLDHVFTLTHEAGHSMHSYLSSKHQSFEYYGYTIFVAEVASTFNEQLLSRHLLARTRSKQERAYLINHDLDAIRGTIIRQTMFAEFEKITHAMAEAGEPLTVESFKRVYRELLEAYFGPDFAIDDELSLECFRIPHFYRAFYVYKYATGLSAAIALAQRVTEGGKRELDDYLGFLKGGCSKYPLDLLRGAGVDMEQPDAVNTALEHFGKMVDELDSLL
ncbi:MAG: oligoendopeptidase F [Planctomycetales bacterium]|nr:oligoendopeptidase F [Planctomycetales bacterium]